MRETIKTPTREPKNQTYEFPTEIGDYSVFPVYGGWSFSPTLANGGDTWGEDDCTMFETAREALASAVLWAQQEYDGVQIPENVSRVCPHWDRPGKTFYPGGWEVDGFLFDSLQEAVEYTPNV